MHLHLMSRKKEQRTAGVEPSSVGVGRLKRETSAELPATRRDSDTIAVPRPKARRRAVNYSKVRRAVDVAVRRLEARMVQRVDEVSSQLHAEPLAKMEVLAQG